MSCIRSISNLIDENSVHGDWTMYIAVHRRFPNLGSLRGGLDQKKGNPCTHGPAVGLESAGVLQTGCIASLWIIYAAAVTLTPPGLGDRALLFGSMLQIWPKRYSGP